MYSDKFVVAIKAGGKILRETKDLVHLPFGSEFSVLVKNLNGRRAKFSLHIDGDDVLDGEHIIVDGNAETEIKRYIRNGNMKEGNAFKFIERTKKIEDGFRGIKVDDGLIRVEFWFEQEAPVTTTTYHRDIWYKDYHYHRPYYWNGGSFGSGTLMGSVQGGLGSKGIAGNSASEVYCNAATATNTANTVSDSQELSSTRSYNATTNDVGITVPGSKVDQEFKTVYGFNSEAVSHVIIMKIVGMIGKVEVTEPVTVKSKQKCPTCEHMNKANSKFCSDCGTSLILV